MPCEKRPRSDSRADLYWRNLKTTTIPISQGLQELIRADLKKVWHWERLENSRVEVKVNWHTYDANMVVLQHEIELVKPKQLLLFCNKATAFYYMQTAHHEDSRGNMTCIPGMIFAMIAREWLQCHDFKPNIEFGHYVANPIRIATGGLRMSRVLSGLTNPFVGNHPSLCTRPDKDTYRLPYIPK